jgi:glucoamylase
VHRSLSALLAAAALLLALVPVAEAQKKKPTWTSADKHGFGTSATRDSKVWFTLGSRGELTEVYWPNLGTPQVRDLEVIVAEADGVAQRETEATTTRTELVDGRSLSFRQVNTSRDGDYTITKTYVTDPARDTLLIDVQVEGSDVENVFVEFDPSLSNDGSDDSARRSLAWDKNSAVALEASPRLAFDPAEGGRRSRDVVVEARPTDGRHFTLALGFAPTRARARANARATLAEGFATIATRYADGWHAKLDSLPPAPAAAQSHGPLYDVSTMVLAASEDKTYRGAYIASPSMPWAFGQGLEDPSGPYHLVWSRDLYQKATALLAVGDRAGAERALDYLFNRQQKPDGSFPQNSEVNGKPRWESLQMDEVALPIVLAGQLNRFDDHSTWIGVRAAADFIVKEGPVTKQERWENQSGYSPGTIASEIAALVVAGDFAARNGDSVRARRYRRIADFWQANVEKWTATTNGPFATGPYYLRLTKHRDPNRPTTYEMGDGGPKAIDQRGVVDPTFLELVRLGVKRPDDPAIVNTLKVVDEQLAVDTPNGRYWHRYNEDGYGEKTNGAAWVISDPGANKTFGRAWPIFAGERGEYELLVGDTTSPPERLDAIAKSANDGWMLPEQVWDGNPPTGPLFPPGEGTTSATPLAWTHAQFLRLAWSIEAGRPVELPIAVACRYTGRCS